MWKYTIVRVSLIELNEIALIMAGLFITCITSRMTLIFLAKIPLPFLVLISCHLATLRFLVLAFTFICCASMFWIV